MAQETPSSRPRDLPADEREATDQPPPIQAPLSRRQIRSLVIPGALLLLLIIAILWGLLSSAPRTPATAANGPAASSTPSAPTALSSATVAPAAASATPVAVVADSPTPPPPAATATDPVIALPTDTRPAASEASPTPVPSSTLPPSATAQALSPTASPPAPSSADLERPLLGRRIGLDPGHGPRKDLGAVLVDPDSGKLILSEDELNLDVGLRTAALLRARGAAVVLTRETKDSFTAPWPPDTNGDGIKGGQSDDLQERIDIINDFHAEVFLSIHANSSANPAKRKGIQALYCGGTGRADCPFQDDEIRLGKLALDQLEAHLAAIGYPVEQREVRNDLWRDTLDEPLQHLYLLGPAHMPGHPRAMHMPGVIVESLYVTSPTEAAELKQDSVRQAIAEAYADALQQYLTQAP